MAWPNNYVQGVYDETGKVIGIDDYAGSYKTLPTIINAEIFGFFPGVGRDNTAAFLALANWAKSKVYASQPIIEFQPGYYESDYIDIPKSTVGIRPVTVAIRGAGRGEVIFLARSNVLPSSVFMTISAAFANNFELSKFSVQGRPSNTLQDGIAIVSDYYTGGSSGGISYGDFKTINVSEFTGRQMWIRGGFNSNLLPIQFTNFTSVGAIRPAGVHVPSFEITGQVGQIEFTNCEFSGMSVTNNGGPSALIGTDYRHQRLFVSSVDLTANAITSTNTDFKTVSSIFYPNCAPVRVIGANLPSPLVLGTTYYLSKFQNNAEITASISTTTLDVTAVTKGNLKIGQLITGQNVINGTTITGYGTGTGGIGTYTVSASQTAASATVFASNTLDTQFRLSTSRANAAAGTVIDLTTTGIVANYSFVGLWADSIDATSNTFTTNEPHRLITGDPISLIGSNVPAGLSAATVYYVIRIDHFTFKLATSSVNAFSGTAIDITTTGTASDFGFILYDGRPGNGGYSINGTVTLQQCDTGMQCNFVTDININAHLESVKRGFDFIGNAVQSSRLFGGHYGYLACSDNGSGLIASYSGGGHHVQDGSPYYGSSLTALSGDRFYKAYGSSFICQPECNNYTITYTATITPPPVASVLRCSLTGNVYVNSPADIPPRGNEIELTFISDGTPRTPTWHGVYKGAPTASASSANQELIVRFKSNGTSLIKIFDTGWYTP